MTDCILFIFQVNRPGIFFFVFSLQGLGMNSSCVNNIEKGKLSFLHYNS